MRKLLERRDLLILIAVSLAALLLLLPHLFRQNRRIAEISVDGKIIETMDLDALHGSVEKELPCSPAVRIRAEQGRIRVIEASCPDKLCKNCGWLDSAGDLAVCLPAKVVISVTGGKTTDKNQPDMITY